MLWAVNADASPNAALARRRSKRRLADRGQQQAAHDASMTAAEAELKLAHEAHRRALAQLREDVSRWQSPAAAWFAFDEEDAAWREYCGVRLWMAKLSWQKVRVAHFAWAEQQVRRWKGTGQPIDTDAEAWTPEHYASLRAVSADAYQSTSWWQARSAEQRKTNPACERCGSTAELHAHHLHYDNVGAERVSMDMMSLCKHCHRSGEHASHA